MAHSSLIINPLCVISAYVLKKNKCVGEGCPFIFLFFFVLNGLTAQVSLGKMFGNNMVLQREKPIHIFGKGTPTEGVSVPLFSKTIATTIKADSTWDAWISDFGNAPPKSDSHCEERSNHIRHLL